MPFAFFKVDAVTPDDGQKLLNTFCHQHRVVTVEKHLVSQGLESFWAICVTYITSDTPPQQRSSRRDRIDYREVLSPEDFTTYAELRSLRKNLAQQEGVPAYALFTHEQLATMVTQRVRNLTQLGEIEGVGTARLEKYGVAFLNCLQQTSSGSTQHAPTRHLTD